MRDTTEKLQTKEWEHMSVRIPKETKDKLREDAKNNLRPIGMHLSWIVINYLENKKGKVGVGTTSPDLLS